MPRRGMNLRLLPVASLQSSVPRLPREAAATLSGSTKDKKMKWCFPIICILSPILAWCQLIRWRILDGAREVSRYHACVLRLGYCVFHGILNVVRLARAENLDGRTALVLARFGEKLWFPLY